ncbi:MAG: glutathione S-transferase N-terminal domain-containing protein [Chlamydiota bacterium]|nr:glutathione S-transferase N-terminal domain-containing protein [Chlamydiota bacterium]
MRNYLVSITSTLAVALVMVSGSLSAYGGQDHGKNSDAQSTPVLYYSTGCPHCTTVLNYVDDTNAHVIKKDISFANNKREFRKTGSRKIPVLVVDGRVITGASNILSYFNSKTGALY